MASRYFTRAGAEAKVGTRIQTLREFSGVPQGTRGIVIRADHRTDGEYTVGIQWDLPHRQGPFGGKPLVDWFDQQEYEAFLQER